MGVQLFRAIAPPGGPGGVIPNYLSRRLGSGGAGLGLAIAKEIVEAHGGTITARNDGGLVFDLALPCEEDGIHA